MSILPGARLGQYEILFAIGAGGMGEVYRARDTRLNRDVAIKVLPTHLAADDASRARFEREALAIASLSHPNILAIHDFGQDKEVAFAVTELLEGETLRDRLEREPLPLRKVIQIGADTGQGLAAAHDKGVVHRDVKPENVFLTADGRVKILDFGLAKSLTSEGANASSDALNTRTVLRRTEAGTVMGTVGYMSPEQVKGKDADHRSDIFSLGCVLYEMATGRRAFERETAAETMTAILRDEPPDASLETRAMPAALDQLIRQCLEKRPEERFQSARDLSFALRALSGTTRASGSSVIVAPSRRRYAIAAVVVVLGAAAAFLAYRSIAREVSPSSQSQIASFAQVTDQPGIETSPTLAPDGKTVVYARVAGADSALFLQRVGTRNPVRLSGPAPALDSEPSLSPDGERIAFRSERDGGGIFVMSVTGESVTRLTDFGFSPTWSPDGRYIAVAATAFFNPTDVQEYPQALTVVNVQSGERRDVAKSGVQPAWSPHGTRVAYWTLHKGGQRDIWTVAAGETSVQTTPVPVTDDAAVDWSPTWAPDGRALYFSSTRGGTMNLWRVAIDEASGRVLGEPEPVTTPSTWTGRFSFSHDGTRLVFATLDYRSTLLRAPFDPMKETLTGPPVPMLKGTRAIRDHQLSPDGEWMVFAEAGVQEDLFVARVDGSQYRRLTDDAFRDRGPHWTPDGARIGFYSDRSGVYDLWTIRPDGSGLTAITKNVGSPGFPVWSPDGRRMAFGYAGNWYMIESPTAGNPVLTQPPVMPTLDARFSPASWSIDGLRIVGMTGSPLASLAVYSVATKQFSAVPGDVARGYWLFPVWMSDGRRVIVRRPDGIALVDTSTGAGRLVIPVGGYMIGCSVGLSRDNRWITYTETATEGDIWIATLKTSGDPSR